MYSKYLDILIALMTNLALTHWKSRTVPKLAKELAFSESDVRATFEAFPGIFRKSINTDKGEHYFTLHVRFALRATEQEDGPLPEVRPELLKVLLEVVSQRAAAESEEQRFLQELTQTAGNARLAARAALCAAVLAAIAVILAAILK